MYTLPTIAALQCLSPETFYQLKVRMMINIDQRYNAHMYQSFHTQPKLHQANPLLIYFCSVK